MSDISERQRAEAALRESEDRYRDLVENSRDLICTHDLEGNLLSVNEAAVRFTGYSREALQQMNLADLLAPEVRTSFAAYLGAIRATGRAKGLMRIRTASGETRYWEYDNSLRTRGVPVPVVRGMAHDVTAARRAKQALRESEERHRALFESNPQPLWVFDSETLRFLAVNRTAVLSYGYSEDEFLAMTILDIRPREDLERLREAVGRRGRGRTTKELWHHRKRDGEIIDVEISSEGITFDGREARLVLAQDITARRILEAELQQAQKIEAIGQLAGGMAHDFNNILGVILGYGELVESELEPGSPAREHVAEMVKAAQRAATLTHQLQAFSRRQILQPKRLDLNSLVANTQMMLGRLIGEHIALVTRPAADLGTVRADPGQIDQILLNLAVNARDAMPAGGTLTIETANFDLREDYAAVHPPTTPGRYVVLVVSDTGVGMDAETQRRIFEPFFTTKPAGQGTGLGLAMVYGIVKQSGGYIWVYSEPGLGTTFKIYLPRIDETPEDHPASAAAEIHLGGSETILLVEDNPALREVIRRRLAEAGYAVLLATDGEEAWALASAHAGPIDLLLTDVVMPNLGGRELGRRLSAERPGLRVLYMSGYTDGALQQHGTLADGVVLLEKPFTGEALARMVRAVLNRRSPDRLGTESA